MKTMNTAKENKTIQQQTVIETKKGCSEAATCEMATYCGGSCIGKFASEK